MPFLSVVSGAYSCHRRRFSRISFSRHRGNVTYPAMTYSPRTAAVPLSALSMGFTLSLPQRERAPYSLRGFRTGSGAGLPESPRPSDELHHGTWLASTVAIASSRALLARWRCIRNTARQRNINVVIVRFAGTRQKFKTHQMGASKESPNLRPRC